LLRLAAGAALSFALAACGGGGGGGTTAPTATYQVSGSLTGLSTGASVVLQDNGGDALTLTGNGPFTFATQIATGAAYDVTVKTQPAGQTCTVTNGSGHMASSNITNVAVNCLNQGESLLYSFGSGTDGQLPEASLTLDSSGALYGTTAGGGTNNTGTVFKLTPDGSGGYTESLLHSFGTGTDGQNPLASLTLDSSSGALYGTTDSGGTNHTGTVFKLTPNGSGGYTESLLHSFGTGTDGQLPSAGLTLDSSGALYGTTFHGGTNGDGTVFKLTPNGSGGYTESLLYSFAGGTDGQFPDASLTLDSSGALYGTTVSGGTNGTGTVFKLTPNGSGGYTESLLHSFAGGTDGQHPVASLTLDSSGALYGTTIYGGTNGKGTVFRIVP
jgi:uncharacterized repeat protein (TIGR03803 family)